MGFSYKNVVDTSRPYFRVDVVHEAGLLALNRFWPRGSQIFVQAESASYEETVDRNGESWLNKTSDLYKVTFLDPEKDEKAKEDVALEFAKGGVLEEPVELFDENKLSIDKIVLPAPKPRGRPKKSTKE